MKIVGNTVGTSLPKPDLRQKDPRKGDFVKGKDEIAELVNDALAEAKASGEFKGDPGEKGDPGDPGKDGYTPQKNIDYFDGEPGKDGYTPVKNVDYFDGQPGKDGEPGADGKDYVLTDDDRAEIAGMAAEMVDVPEVTVPTKVSQLTNDSGFQTASEVTAIVEEAIADIEIPSGGGEALSEEWTEEVLLSGVLATTDAAGMLDTGLTWADLKEYDIIQFSYNGSIAGDVFLGFAAETNNSQWGYMCTFFRGGLQQVGFIRIYPMGGGTVAEVLSATAKATNMLQGVIAGNSTRNFTATAYSANLVKMKGSVSSQNKTQIFSDDARFKIYFTNAPTADLTWHLIGGKY